MIYAIIVGGSNVAFYKQLKAAGVDLNKQTLMTISVTEDEIVGIGGENIVGAYACMKYFQSLDNPNNKAFVSAFKKMWGDKIVIGDVTQAAYLGPWLWKLTVEKAGSFDIDKIAAASPGVEFKGAPEGYVRIHENHHLWSKTRVGRARSRRPVRHGLRNGRADGARSLPEGLPVAHRPGAPVPATGAPVPRRHRQRCHRNCSVTADGATRCSATIRSASWARSWRCRVSPGSSCSRCSC